MVRIEEPVLTVERVEGSPGRRRLVVTFRLVAEITELDDPSAAPVGITERAVVRSHHVLDAPVAPAALDVELAHRGALASVVSERRLVVEIDRSDLDVQRDWWSTDHGGGVEPIAELLDHIGADITVEVAGREPVTAKTPIVTGSWGALGRD